MDIQRILKGSRVAEIDKKAIRDGIDSKRLMKNAGFHIAEIIKNDFNIASSRGQIYGIIVCGGGNNGGDGFVAAKELMEYGFKIKVFHIVENSRFSPDSNFYFNEFDNIDRQNIYFLQPATGIWNFFENEIKKADFILDAIFGTGLHGKEIYGSALEVINALNNVRNENETLTVYSADIPSGIDSNDGSILGSAIRAAKTVTFGCKKIGLVCYPGADYAGGIEVVDIGIPRKYYNEYEEIFEASLEWVAGKLPCKKPWTYKHMAGSLLVIAGSIGFTGAASMSCLAALRSGAGLVTLVCPEGLNHIFEEKLTEVMTFPVKQTENHTLHIDSLDEIMCIVPGFDAVAIGPGISRNRITLELVRELIRKIDKPIVLDADGLYALKNINTGSGVDKINLSKLVITPHPGELAAILEKQSIPQARRIDINIDTAKNFNLVSVLKGAGTIISEPSGKTFINRTGSWALATAGSGDILTGIIGSFLCQGMDKMESAVCGAYVHGLAADLISKKTSRTAMIASDLLGGLKDVFDKIEKIKY